MTRLLRTTVTGLFVVALAWGGGPACEEEKKGGGGGSGGGGGGAWLVGAEGLMLRLGHDDPVAVDGYDVRTRANLRAIACRGAAEAWVAGDEGTILRTRDGGATWERVRTALAGRLDAVAVAHEPARVFVAGEGGALAVGVDGAFAVVPAPRDAHFLTVATVHDGSDAFLGTDDGRLFRLESGALALVELPGRHGGAIRGLTATSDGRRVLAVGDAGLVLASDDGGRSFRALAPFTSRALHDVWLAADGSRAFVVGGAGLVVELEGDRVRASRELLPDGQALRALHLGAFGAGTAVGDDGRAFMTHDEGKTWVPVDLGTRLPLFGVDDLHGEPHL